MDINKNNLAKIKRKEKFLRLLSNLLSIGLIVFGILWVNYSKKNVEISKEQIKQLKEEEIQISKRLEQKKDSLENLKVNLIQAQGQNLEKRVNEELANKQGDKNIDSLKNKIKDIIINKSLLANKYINILTKNTDTIANKNITLKYYTKSLDDEKIEGLLKSLGYNFVTRSTYIKDLKDKKNNCLYFGAEVPENDIKIIALTLIRGGVQLENIRQFVHYRIGKSYKSNIVEVLSCPEKYVNGELKIEDIYSGKAIEYLDYETID